MRDGPAEPSLLLVARTLRQDNESGVQLGVGAQAAEIRVVVRDEREASIDGADDQLVVRSAEPPRSRVQVAS